MKSSNHNHIDLVKLKCFIQSFWLIREYPTVSSEELDEKFTEWCAKYGEDFGTLSAIIVAGMEDPMDGDSDLVNKVKSELDEVWKVRDRLLGLDIDNKAMEHILSFHVVWRTKNIQNIINSIGEELHDGHFYPLCA